ncbi:MAG TPA: cytochrome c biogenesis protein CcdA [Desulfobacteraceae bacterium]|nr:cytochrome c biogenesis protein CcdA [Deltaproteobacteria bacterium]MBW2356570.1 cytochrome c biogenesis protein CcdA [Deltaproteobacteria bacterium]HDI61024.1 cytochrome c biogenesis protein CcdA [Desulfobacteraceae bacterium]
MPIEGISYGAALAAGLLSFFSPCILPLVPAYFTFITGFSLEELTGARRPGLRGAVVRATLAYVLGFSLVFILLGASASLFGSLAFAYRDTIRIVGGALIVIFGIHLTGIWRIGWLDFEKRVHLNRKPMHLLGTFLVGMAFGAGWSPCIGPLLGSILIVAGNQETVGQGILLLSLYAAGLAIPFLTLSVFINLLLVFVRKAAPAIRYLNMAAGILLIFIGLLLLTNRLHWISGALGVT